MSLRTDDLQAESRHALAVRLHVRPGYERPTAHRSLRNALVADGDRSGSIAPVEPDDEAPGQNTRDRWPKSAVMLRIEAACRQHRHQRHDKREHCRNPKEDSVHSSAVVKNALAAANLATGPARSVAAESLGQIAPVRRAGISRVGPDN